MIRLLSLIVAILFGYLPAAAEIVVVRSGEHSGFTRIAMQLPSKVSWSFNQSSRSLALKVDDPSVQFDVSGVFDRIPRGRLVALTQDSPGSELIFSLGCSCSFTSFLDGPGFLVIDLKDEFETPATRRRTLVSPNNQNPYRFSLPVNPQHVIPSRSQKLMFPVISAQAPEPSIVTPPLLPVNFGPRWQHDAIVASEKSLLAQIDRALDQGLIEVREKQQTESLATKTREAPVRQRTPLVLATSAGPLPVSLSANTSIDRGMARTARPDSHSNTMSTCLDSNLVAMHEWGGNKPYSYEIGYRRSLIYGEFDKLRPDKTLDLARAYLHYGFGAEASLAVDLSSHPSNEGNLLKALAQVMDTGGTIQDNPFSEQQQCDGDVALWAVLSAANMASDVNKNAVQLAFSRLPPHLRSYLGPKISQKFVDIGDSETANFILRAIERVEAEPGSGIELAKAALAEMHGDSMTAEMELAKSVATGSEHSPEALVKTVTQKFHSRDTVAPETIVLAEAYAMEYRNAAIGIDLRRTLAIAQALAGQFDQAFGTLQEVGEMDGHSNRQLALFSVLALLTERANDVTFLRLSLYSAQKIEGDVPKEIGNQIARRLLDLGFPEQAAHWLPVSSEATTSNELRLLKAEISLSRQLPHRAMVELLGLDGVEAARLRAAAMWQAGNHHQAGQLLTSAEDYDGAARGFWLAEEWDSVPKQADAHYAQIVAGSVQLRANDAIETPPTPLAEARVLVQNSFAARAGIAELLNKLQLNSP